MSTERPRQPHHRGEPTKERASKFVQSFQPPITTSTTSRENRTPSQVLQRSQRMLECQRFPSATSLRRWLQQAND